MKIIEPQYVWNGELTKRTQPIYRIILHHAAASHCSAVQVHSWHKARGWVGIGYHFFITKDGDIYRGRPIDCIGAHAGGYNLDSIGICFEGNFENEVMQNAQEEAGRELVKMLMRLISSSCNSSFHVAVVCSWLFATKLPLLITHLQVFSMPKESYIPHVSMIFSLL